MAARHGRNGRLLVSVDGTAAPSPVGILRSYTTDFSTDKVEVTGMGDSNKSYVAGLPDFTISGDGIYDASPGTNSSAFYRGAVDGLARNFYLYPNFSVTAEYVYGSALFDFSMSGAVDAAVAFSFNGQAAGPVTLKTA